MDKVVNKNKNKNKIKPFRQKIDILDHQILNPN